MTTLIFGIGPGLFIILSLWVSTALVCLISLRTERRIGALAVAVAGIITVILISVPRASKDPDVTDNKPYDQLFVWRTILVVLLAVSSLVGLLGYIKFDLVEPVRPVRLRNWVN